MEDSIVDTYSTKDLHFAAFLQVKGVPIKKLEQYGRIDDEQNPVYFIFDGREKCEQLEDIFWNGTGEEIMVNAKDYFTVIRDLRARVYSITNLVRKKRFSVE